MALLRRGEIGASSQCGERIGANTEDETNCDLSAQNKPYCNSNRWFDNSGTYMRANGDLCAVLSHVYVCKHTMQLRAFSPPAYGTLPVWGRRAPGGPWKKSFVIVRRIGKAFSRKKRRPHKTCIQSNTDKRGRVNAEAFAIRQRKCAAIGEVWGLIIGRVRACVRASH